MPSSLPTRRSAPLGAAVLAAVAVVAALVMPLAGPAEAASDRAAQRKAGAPGSFTGYGFDACTAPPQAVMDEWWQESPYAAVGIYIGGSNRVCTQPELTAEWVRQQQRTGWHLLPVQVGPQASCSGYADRMSADLPTAHGQGVAEADAAVATARSLGVRARSTLYYDLEDYDLTPDDCRRAALSFLSGWTEELHRSGYASGVYSNLGAAITSLDLADRVSPGSYAMPDDIWFAWANGRADTATDARVLSHEWDDHARIHQYALDVPQTYGGYGLTIDSNWVDVGDGPVGSPSKPLCRGVDVELRRYPKLRPGSHGPAVAAAQCLLRRLGIARTGSSGRYDATTARAVRKAEHKLHLPRNGKVTRRTWVAMLAHGSHPLVKVGTTGDAVRRLQRALGAVSGKRVKVDGVMSQATERVVRRYQRKAGLSATGVVTGAVWERLRAGR